MADTCPHCGTSVLFISDICPSCQADRAKPQTDEASRLERERQSRRTASAPGKLQIVWAFISILVGLGLLIVPPLIGIQIGWVRAVLIGLLILGGGFTTLSKWQRSKYK